MARHHTKKKKRPRPQRHTETRASVSVTIAWTLTVITTLVCDLGSAAARFYVRAQSAAVREQSATVRIDVLSQFLLFAAVTIGVISLMLLPVVFKVRHQAPPRAFMVFAIIVAAAPVVAAVVQVAR